MNDPYAFYVITAYAVTLLLLGALLGISLWQWRNTRKKTIRNTNA